MADNRDFFRSVLIGLDSWTRWATCEGECADCEQFEECKKIISLKKELSTLFTQVELDSMGVI